MFPQDLPVYDPSFVTVIVLASYALDFLEFVLLYVLPVAAVLTALVIARRLLLLLRRRPYAAAPTSDDGVATLGSEHGSEVGLEHGAHARDCEQELVTSA